MATPASKARMDTTIVKLVERLDDAHSQHRLSRDRRQPDGQSRHAHREGGRGRRDRVELRQPARRRVGHVHGLRHQEQDGAGDRDELRGLRPALSSHRAATRVRSCASTREPSRSAKCRCTTRSARSRAPRSRTRYVLLSAHFDSWDGSQGATDNGTGTITMMEAMRILKQAYPHPKRTIMVGHWPGEEQGLNGSHAFAYDHPEIVREIQARLQPGQRHRTHPEHVGRRTAERRRAHAGVAREASAGVSGAGSLHRRRRAGDRRHRQRVVQLLRRAGVRTRLARTGTTARTRTTPTATASTRSCSTISRGTRRSSRCSRISRPRIRRSSRASAPISRPAAAVAAAVAAGVARRAGRAAIAARLASAAAVRGGGGGRGNARREGLGTDLPEDAALHQRHVARHGAVDAPVAIGADTADDEPAVDAVARTDRAREPHALHRAGSRARRRRRARSARLRQSLYEWSIREPRAVLARGLAFLRDRRRRRTIPTVACERPADRPRPRGAAGSRARTRNGSSARGSTSPRTCCATDDDREALVFWNERGAQRRLTYRELYAEVARVAAALRAHGRRRRRSRRRLPAEHSRDGRSRCSRRRASARSGRRARRTSA